MLVWDAPHEHLVPGASRGFSPETLARMSHGPGQGITAEVARTGQPIAVGDEVFGVFGVNYCQPRHFSGEEQRLLLALAQRSSRAPPGVGHAYALPSSACVSRRSPQTGRRAALATGVPIGLTGRTTTPAAT